MESNPALSLTIICGFFAVFAGMIALVIFIAQKDKAKRDKFAQAHGFTEVKDSSALLERVAYVNGITRLDLYRLFQVYRRTSTSGGEVYLFNLLRHDVRRGHRAGGGHSSRTHTHPLETEAFAFVTPSWHLPIFTAMPRLQGGLLANMGNRLAEMAADIKMDVVKFPHLPEIDEKYLIAAPDNSLTLPDAFLQALASYPNLHFHAGGDTLTLSYSNSTTQSPDVEQLEKLYKIGLQLAKVIQAK